MLETYALGIHEHQGTGEEAALHHGEHMSRAHRELERLVRDVIAEGGSAGHFRTDVSPEELAT
jgi:hypothetical protein